MYSNGILSELCFELKILQATSLCALLRIAIVPSVNAKVKLLQYILKLRS